MKSFELLYSFLSFGFIAIVISVAVFFVSSCGGGGSSQIIVPPDQNSNDNGGNPPGDDDGATNPPDDGTTPPDDGSDTPPPVAPIIEGIIDLSGIPVSDATGVPADITRTTLKVIDPSEEIGDMPTVAPTPAGTYVIDGLAPATVSYLNISFNTNVDLKGIGQTVTPVSVNLPIQLANGVVTTVDTSIAVFAPKITASQRFGSDDDDNGGMDDNGQDGDGNDDGGGMDDNGQDGDGNDDGGGDDGSGMDDSDNGSIEISYSYQGPDGARTGKFVINYRSNQTIYDLDGDGAYDDDVTHIDDDNDGIRDDRHDEDRNGKDFEDVEAEGLVEGIGGGLLTVDSVSFIVDERTNFEEGLKLSQIAIGANLKVKGYRTPSGKIFAVEIELED